LMSNPTLNESAVSQTVAALGVNGGFAVRDGRPLVAAHSSRDVCVMLTPPQVHLHGDVLQAEVPFAVLSDCVPHGALLAWKAS
jgi:hypothetical protein